VSAKPVQPAAGGKKAGWTGKFKKLERKLQRAEERLASSEMVVDRTQHMLNTRIDEVESARQALSGRTEQLEQSETRFRNLSEAAFEAILVHLDGKIVDCNEAAVHFYRCSKAAIIGSDLETFVSPAFRKELGDWVKRSTLGVVEVTHLTAGGEPVPVEVRSKSMETSQGESIVSAVRDISTHRKLQQRLLVLANSDSLTGIGNRRCFIEAATDEFVRTLRYRQPLSMIMLDIDHFKSINDQYGHDVGDHALKNLVECCRPIQRENDIFGRLGGEEFGLLLPSTDLPKARGVAERIRGRIEQLELHHEGGNFSITASLGVAEYTSDDQDIHSLMKRADIALYDAKNGGRNRVAVA